MKEENKVWGYFIGFFLIYVLKLFWDHYWWNEVYFCFENSICFVLTLISHAIPTTIGEILIIGLLTWLVFWLVNKK